MRDARKAMPWLAKHVSVVLEVLAELGLGAVLQPGPEPFAGAAVRRQLRRRAGVVVRRAAGRRRLVPLDREGNADQAARSRIEAGGFGVERPGRFRVIFASAPSLGIGQDGFVMPPRCAFGQAAACPRRVGAIAAPLLPAPLRSPAPAQLLNSKRWNPSVAVPACLSGARGARSS